MATTPFIIAFSIVGAIIVAYGSYGAWASLLYLSVTSIQPLSGRRRTVSSATNPCIATRSNRLARAARTAAFGRSETDSEVVAHLVAREVEGGAAPEEAVATVLPRLHGAFAIAFLFRDHPDLIIGACHAGFRFCRPDGTR